MQPNTTPQPLTPETVSAILRDPDSPYYPSRITMFCDHCGVERTGEYMVSEDMTSRERLGVARQHLVQNEGWEHTSDGDDFCPEHAAPKTSEQPAACGKCRTAFDPADTRFAGHAQHGTTAFCRRCVDACHDNEIADHRCVICA
ncbi:hypothetical protein [Streptomyces bobili]|uniref:hypothetical protein n=1 Tax=Streptomyces bobili TaxID=67280 RepID=UPI000A376181|nr:hypothetical protein [Streptomyces bobili]